MIGLLNLGSLVLGVVAWILPVVNLMRYKNQGNRNWAFLSIMSISACAISLCLHILLTVTIILNAITLIAYRDKTSK
ncbi:MAG: hypothetical protein JG777_3211 [Clostridia bacterium]|nr:hypothetical protein [Clostridia bacterium]